MPDLNTLLDQHVTLVYESVDRIFLNAYVAKLQILSLATDFPRLWADPSTPDRERKRMVRLMLEDVTLSMNGQIVAHVRFRGGATRTLRLPVVDLRSGRRHEDPASAGGVRLPDSETGLLESIDEGGRCAGRKVDGPGEASDGHRPLPVENIRRQEVRRRLTSGLQLDDAHGRLAPTGPEG